MPRPRRPRRQTPPHLPGGSGHPPAQRRRSVRRSQKKSAPRFARERKGEIVEEEAFIERRRQRAKGAVSSEEVESPEKEASKAKAPRLVIRKSRGRRKRPFLLVFAVVFVIAPIVCFLAWLAFMGYGFWADESAKDLSMDITPPASAYGSDGFGTLVDRFSAKRSPSDVSSAIRLTGRVETRDALFSVAFYVNGQRSLLRFRNALNQIELGFIDGNFWQAEGPTDGSLVAVEPSLLCRQVFELARNILTNPFAASISRMGSVRAREALGAGELKTIDGRPYRRFVQREDGREILEWFVDDFREVVWMQRKLGVSGWERVFQDYKELGQATFPQTVTQRPIDPDSNELLSLKVTDLILDYELPPTDFRPPEDR